MAPSTCSGAVGAEEDSVLDELACRRCGRGHQEDQRFCGGCGDPLVLACPACAAENPARFRFCGGCGSALGGAHDRAGTARPTGRQERRWATVVFADLSGFTGMSEATDPEEVRAIVHRCVSHMAGVIEAHGGWLDNVMGDGVLSVFGADTAHGDDAERAVRTALALLECSAEHADDFAGLTLSVGVNTGEVMYASVGPGDGREPTVMGDAVNTAARLQAAAPAGSIFVGAETWRATRGTVEYEPVPPVAAKGKREPVPAWRAVRASALEAGRPISRVSLVGRDVELATLERVWRRALEERRPELVTVTGPAGIGKTKLASGLVARAQADGALVAHGRSLPYGESTGFGAFAKAVRSMAGISDDDPEDEAVATLDRLVRRHRDDADATALVQNLAVLLGLRAGGGTDRETLLFSARSFVELLAAGTPILFVFEDIHWADPSVLELVEVLATRCRDAPVVLLTLSRPELFETAPRWGGGVPAYTAMPLSELGDAASVALAAAHLGDDVPADVAARIAATAEGNPLFIEELASAVAERATDLDAELPTNVRTIIASRIDALPDDERAVLLDASVVGKVFWDGVLHRLGHAGTDRVLDSLDRRDLIRREAGSRFSGEREFTFRHMLIREVAYATLPRSTRRARHAEVAAFLEQATAEGSVELASVVGHHWREAGKDGRAVDCFVAAAERAAAAWAAEEAAQLYTDAMSLVPEDDVERRRSLRRARGMVLANAGFYSEAAGDLDAVLPDLRGVERGEALLARGGAAIWLMDADTVGRCAAEVLAGADELGQELVGPALSLSAVARSVDGDLDASLALHEQALDAWLPDTRPAQLANDLAMVSLTAYWVGDHDRAIEHGRRSYEMALEHRVVSAALQGGSHQAMALAGAGRHEEALELFEKVTAQGRELERRPRLTSRTLNMMAAALREVGEPDEARLRNEEGVEHAIAADFGAAETQGGIDLLLADIADGDLGAAERRYRSLVEAVEALTGWHQWLGRTRLALGRAQLALLLGDDDAAQLAASAADRARSVRRRKYEALSLAVLGAAHLRGGRADEAVDALRTAAGIAADLGHPPTAWQVRAELARTLAAVGSDDAAAAVAADARRSVDDFAARLGPSRRERFERGSAALAVRELHRDLG